MTDIGKRSIGSWVQFLSSRKIPVMRQTARSLEEARKRIEFMPIYREKAARVVAFRQSLDSATAEVEIDESDLAA